MASGMIPLEATAARQRVGSFRSRLKKQQPIMMSEPPTWGGATANPETLLRSLPTSVSSVDFPCNVAVTVHEFIDSNQEICDLWYDTIYWYKIYYLTFRFMCLGDLKLRISFRNFRDKSKANSGSFNGMFNWISSFSSCRNGIRDDTAARQCSAWALGSFRSWLKKQQPIMMSEPSISWRSNSQSKNLALLDFPWIPIKRYVIYSMIG